MKAESMKSHPNYELFKQNDIVSFYHFQLPRWLIEDSRYIGMSLEAKFTYTLLFNRFQLSKHNGWINENGEVFVIYTRKELSERLNISEKRVSAAMNELKEYLLIWEQRRGRGFANHIYLASVKISLDDALSRKGGPLDYPGEDDTGNTEAAGNTAAEKDTWEAAAKSPGEENAKEIKTINTYVRTAETAVLDFKPETASAALDPLQGRFKNLQNSGSRTVKTEVQELPIPHPSYLDFRTKDFSNSNSSQSKSSPYTPRAETDGQTDAGILNALIERAELEALEVDDAAVIKDAIERLFYSRSIQVGNAVYPNERIKSHLWRLNAIVVQDAVVKMTNNTTVKIRNSSAYVAAVLFNTIMESGSDLIVDPYLNSLRTGYKPDILRSGGG